jgi:hypothetical protein
MLQYGKPIDRNMKSFDLKTKYGVLKYGNIARFGAAFGVFVEPGAWYSLPKRKREAAF